MKPKRLTSLDHQNETWLYRGFVIEKICPPGADSTWFLYDPDYPRGAQTLALACRAIDGLYEGGFMHAHEGPPCDAGWSSEDYRLSYWAV